ncbi:MAG: CopG family transcriptional regulator [Actinomycetota bacterium]
MRTTISLDDDVAALIEAERRRTGETFRQTVNRLLRKAVQRVAMTRSELPRFPGAPLIDISDVSRVLSELDEERRLDRGMAR